MGQERDQGNSFTEDIMAFTTYVHTFITKREKQ